jgi:hypothetical protein
MAQDSGCNSFNYPRLLQHMSYETLSQGMEVAKVIAVAGHKHMLEDGPEVDTSESEKEEHGCELSGMYTSNMLDENGNPVLGRASMTMEQAEASSGQGRAGGRVAARGVG